MTLKIEHIKNIFIIFGLLYIIINGNNIQANEFNLKKIAPSYDIIFMPEHDIRVGSISKLNDASFILVGGTDATISNILYSGDNGQNWKINYKDSNNIKTEYSVPDFKEVITNGEGDFIITAQGRFVYKSDDNGKTLRKIKLDSTLLDGNSLPIAIKNVKDNFVYLVCIDNDKWLKYVFTSNDFGETWTKFPINDYFYSSYFEFINSETIQYFNSSSLWYNDSIYQNITYFKKSIDYGKTWDSIFVDTTNRKNINYLVDSSYYYSIEKQRIYRTNYTKMLFLENNEIYIYDPVPSTWKLTDNNSPIYHDRILYSNNGGHSFETLLIDTNNTKKYFNGKMFYHNGYIYVGYSMNGMYRVDKGTNEVEFVDMPSTFSNDDFFKQNSVPGAELSFYTENKAFVTTNSDFLIKLDFSKTSVNQNTKNEKVRIYPNPATNNVTFQLNNESYIKRYKIYDLKGKLYDNKLMNVHLKNINVNIEDLPVGTYFIEIQTRGKIINKSFVKE